MLKASPKAGKKIKGKEKEKEKAKVFLFIHLFISLLDKSNICFISSN